MNNYYADVMEEAFKSFVKKEPKCNSCQFKKSGLTTICKKYKRIPSSVQQGGFCEKHIQENKEV